MDDELKKKLKGYRGLRHKKNSKYIWYRFQVNKKTFEGSTETTSISKAVEIMEEAKALALDKREVVKARKDGRIALRDIWPKFRSMGGEMKEAKDKRWEAKRKIWLNFVQFIEAKYQKETLAELTRSEVISWATHVKDKGKWLPDGTVKPLSPTTQSEYIVAVKQVWRVMWEEAKATCDHMEKAKLPAVVRESREEFSTKELAAIKNYVDTVEHNSQYLKPLFYVSINTGLRRSDVCTLKGDDIDFKKNKIIKKMEKLKSRTSHTAEIPITPELKSFLKQYPIEKGKYVFDELYKKYEESDTTLSYIFSKMLDDLKIENKKERENGQRKISTKDHHSLRHTFAFKHAMKLTALPIIKNMLGHMSSSMTEKYIRHMDTDAEEKSQQIMRDFDYLEGE